MSNKDDRKKLSLQSETIRTLSSTELHEVNGGTIGPIITASIRFCRYTDKVVKGTIAVGKGIDWLTHHQPKGNPDNPPSVVTATA